MATSTSTSQAFLRDKATETIALADQYEQIAATLRDAAAQMLAVTPNGQSTGVVPQITPKRRGRPPGTGKKQQAAKQPAVKQPPQDPPVA